MEDVSRRLEKQGQRGRGDWIDNSNQQKNNVQKKKRKDKITCSVYLHLRLPQAHCQFAMCRQVLQQMVQRHMPHYGPTFVVANLVVHRRPISMVD
jgi:hypothetical protein